VISGLDVVQKTQAGENKNQSLVKPVIIQNIIKS
jgi:hypothetical protein